MYYSIIPYNNLFPVDENEFDYEEVILDGNTIQVYKQDNKYIIKRVISTNLKVYLDDNFCPGNELKM